MLAKLQGSCQQSTYHTDKKHHARQGKSTGIAKVTYELAEIFWKVTIVSKKACLLEYEVKINILLVSELIPKFLRRESGRITPTDTNITR